MKVIVVGCGRVGSALAYQLHREGHQLTVSDQDSAAFDRLPLDFLTPSTTGAIDGRHVLREQVGVFEGRQRTLMDAADREDDPMAPEVRAQACAGQGQVLRQELGVAGDRKE